MFIEEVGINIEGDKENIVTQLIFLTLDKT